MKRLKLVLAVVVCLCAVCVRNTAAKEKKSDKDGEQVGDTAFLAYDGSQSWPKDKSAQINQDHSIPIYIGLPDKSYKVIGRITDKRDAGFGVMDKAFDEGLGKESHRMRNCANQAKQHGADAIVVTDDQKVIKAFNLTRKEVHKSAPLFKYEHSVVLAVKF